MSDQLDKQLASLIEAAKTAGQDAFAFIQSQAPDVIEQLLRWKIVEAGFTAAGLLILYALVAVAYRALWRASKDWDDPMFARVMVGVGVFSIVGVLSANAIPKVMTGVKAYVAPKVVIIETIASLAKR